MKEILQTYLDGSPLTFIRENYVAAFNNCNGRYIVGAVTDKADENGNLNVIESGQLTPDGEAFLLG